MITLASLNKMHPERPKKERGDNDSHADYTDDFKEDVVNKINSGSNFKTVAELLNIPISDVSKIIKQYRIGLLKCKPLKSKERDNRVYAIRYPLSLKKKAIKRVLNGEDKRAVAIDIGVGKSTLYKWLAKEVSGNICL